MAEASSSASAGIGDTTTTHLNNNGANGEITEVGPDLELGHAAGGANAEVGAEQQQPVGAGQQGGQQAANNVYRAIFLETSNAAQLITNAHVADLSNCGPDGQNALHIAVLRSEDLTLKVLARKPDGLEIDVLDDHRNTPLHYAASVGVKGVTTLLVAENAEMKSMRDAKGMCPIHIAASVGAMDAIRALLVSDNQGIDDASAALLDGNGGTFLHVAVKERQKNVVKFVCRREPWPAFKDNIMLSMGFWDIIGSIKSWLLEFIGGEPRATFKDILNTKDENGNTALHLAVEKRDESTFSYLVGNRYVELNHINDDGYTPLDLASKIKIDNSFASLQNPTEWMIRVLAHSGAHFSARRRDWRFKTQTQTPEHDAQEQPATEGVSGTPQGAQQEPPPATQGDDSGTTRKKEHEGLAASTETVLIASALIATVTFAAAFTVPGSYKTDGDPRAGTPALGRNYGFKVFLVADLLAFFCSVVATFCLAAYGTQWNVDPLVRCIYARRAVQFFHVALKSVIVAFALGVTVVMWDISVVTVAVVGAAALASVLYGNEALAHDLRLIRVMWRRFGLSRSWSLHPATSSHLDWNTWWLKSFSFTLAWNLLELSGAYILIYFLAYIAQLNQKSGK